jgi:hypothetical protein
MLRPQHPSCGASLACLSNWYADFDDGAVNGLSIPVFEFGDMRISPYEQIPDPDAAEGNQGATALKLDATHAFGPN